MASLDTILDNQHRGVLDRAIRNVLGLDLTLQTYSQIIDGLPLGCVTLDLYGSDWTHPTHHDHPILRHKSLCPGAAEAAQDFLSGFDTGTLDFEGKLLEAYQASPPGHRSFQCRLIELVAVAVHKIAVLLFVRGDRIHDRETTDPAYTIEAVTKWLAPRSPMRSPMRETWKLATPPPVTIPPPATLFRHRAYMVLDQYPNGLADAVGYWAENRILGGVVIFDRSEPWDDDRNPEPNVYLHADRNHVTYRVWQVLDHQEQSLLDFLAFSPEAGAGAGAGAAAPNDAPVCPLPLTATEKNEKRLDPEGSTEDKVYRDLWERAPDNGFRHCSKNRLDYPETTKERLERERRERLKRERFEQSVRSEHGGLSVSQWSD